QNLVGARIVGINPERVFSMTWALAAAIGALTGVLAAPLSLLYPDMGTDFLLKGFAGAVLGGLDSVPGAMIGGLAVGVIEMLVGGYVSTSFQQISPFVVIIAVLLIRPHGLLGRRPVQRV
ncbi:MAG: branched-chain amino acid ABC transporter permease, partial [Acetobacteraceae bacterium]